MGKDPFLVPKPFLFAKLKQTHELQQVKDQALDTWACEQRLDKVMRAGLTLSPKTTKNLGKVHIVISFQKFDFRWQRTVITDRREEKQVSHRLSLAYFLERVFGLNHKEGEAKQIPANPLRGGGGSGPEEVRMSRGNKSKHQRKDLHRERTLKTGQGS